MAAYIGLLPPEIIERIVEYAVDPDPYSIQATCRCLYGATTPFIWRRLTINVQLGYCTAFTQYSSSRSHLPREIVHKLDRVKRYVHRLHINLLGGTGSECADLLRFLTSFPALSQVDFTVYREGIEFTSGLVDRFDPAVSISIHVRASLKDLYLSNASRPLERIASRAAVDVCSSSWFELHTVPTVPVTFLESRLSRLDLCICENGLTLSSLNAFLQRFPSVHTVSLDELERLIPDVGQLRLPGTVQKMRIVWSDWPKSDQWGFSISGESLRSVVSHMGIPRTVRIDGSRVSELELVLNSRLDHAASNNYGLSTTNCSIAITATRLEHLDAIGQLIKHTNKSRVSIQCHDADPSEVVALLSKELDRLSISYLRLDIPDCPKWTRQLQAHLPLTELTFDDCPC
ncbi:hypothetical protein TRVA0_004S02608 [Trichomonascus vanleenenianus]|uniref:uncharacterized protein n=1 Tax=Trichomonascus vanleenenianus TaxID=2268995 RepID=UPI003ECA222A